MNQPQPQPKSVSSYIVANSKSDARSMLRLAMPALAEEFLVLAVMWTDWWLTGHFFQQDGDATKTAMSMMGYLLWLIPSMFAAVAIGATALVARYIGSGQTGLAVKTTNQAFVTGAVLAVSMLALAFFFGAKFIAAMQLTGSAAAYALDYFYIVIWSIPLIMFSIVGSSCLRGAGDMVTGFITKSIVVVANILVSLSLVVGWGPFPQVGWHGLAIGTAIGHSLGGLIILMVLMRGRAGLQLRSSWMIPDPAIIGKILRVGLPGGFDVAVLLFSQLIFLAMINALGVAAAAAHGLAVQIEAVCFLPGAAFQAAAATMTGQFLGARLPDRAMRSGWWCLAGGGIVMTVMAVLLFCFGQQFATFFTGIPDDPTGRQSAQLLKIISFVMPFLALGMILTGSLRGAGDTVLPLVFTAFGFFLIRIPLAAWFSFEHLSWLDWTGLDVSGWGWGIVGAWLAMAIDVVVRGLLALGRFMQGGWKSVRV